MDNAKYHRRESYVSDGEKTHKTLSTLNKSELIERLVRLNPELDEGNLQKCKKPELYIMARKPEYHAPLAVEEITVFYFVLFLLPLLALSNVVAFV